MIPQSYTLSAYSYLLLYRLREGLCNKKARFQESRFFEYSIAHLTLIATRKRHNARDVPSAIPIHFLVCQMNTSAYFNRRSPRGERLAQQPCCCETNRFQSTLPVGESDQSPPAKAYAASNFNPRSPWGERPTAKPVTYIGFQISIHAPRGGSDCHDPGKEDSQEISIHAPRGGERHNTHNDGDHQINFNPRSPRGERPLIMGEPAERHISIHAPRGGSDIAA